MLPNIRFHAEPPLLSLKDPSLANEPAAEHAPSPAAILNLPINSFCPLDTALVLTSDNFNLIFPPSPPLLPPSCLATPQVSLLKKLFYVMPCLVCVLIEKDISDHQNILICKENLER